MGNDADEPRFLHRNIAHGYTARHDLAARGEPECVSEDYQRQLTEQARSRETRRRLAAWRPAAELIQSGIAAFAPSADTRSRSDLRVIERTLKRIDQRLGG
jgi:hypothetical protein